MDKIRLGEIRENEKNHIRMFIKTVIYMRKEAGSENR